LTGFSDTVILYNYDLTISQTIKVVIQKNVADSQLKSLEREILCPIGTLKAGMYIYYENRFWLIDGYPGNNKCYEKATMRLCQYKLYWQNAIGEIISRWITTKSEKSSIGEEGNSYLILDSNTFWITLPNDDEVSLLEDKRVFIDRNKTNSRKVFKITKNNDILYDYGEEHGGAADLLVEKVEFNPDTDKQATLPLGETVWIADYVEPVNTEDISHTTWYMQINCPNIYIKPVAISKNIIAHLYNESEVEVTQDIVYEWIINSNISNYITYSVDGNILSISLSKECSAIGENINIQCMSKYTGQIGEINLIVQEVF